MADANATSEHRTSSRLRAIFPDACEALRPFFDPATRWGNHCHEHLAYRTLKEQFPELSGPESFVVVMAAKQLFAECRLIAAP